MGQAPQDMGPSEPDFKLIEGTLDPSFTPCLVILPSKDLSHLITAMCSVSNDSAEPE